MTAFDDRIRALVAHAYDRAPAIRQVMDKAGVTPSDVQTATDLARIPVTSKDALVEIHQNNPPFGGFLAVDPADLPRIYISPGPIYDPQPENPEPAADRLDPFTYVGFGRGDRVLNTFMYHLTPAGLLLDEALRACGASVLPTGPGNTDLQIMMMMALQANGFVGQPSYLGQILDRCAEMGIPKEAVPLKKALFSAEVYTPTQQARFEGEYGMKTTSAYGTADVGLIGYSRHDMQGFRMTQGVYVQICDPQSGAPVPDGEVGEIVVTVFNKAYPLIRFGTGDLGALAPQLIDGAQHLLGLFGRSGEAIKVRGMFLHPNQLRAALTQFPQIQQLQAIVSHVEKKDYLTVKIELKEGYESQGEAIGEQLKALAQAAIRLRVDEVVVVPAGTLKSGDRTVQDTRTWQ